MADPWQEAFDAMQQPAATPTATPTPAPADPWQQAWDDLQKQEQGTAQAPIVVPTQRELETLAAPEGSPEYLAAAAARPLLASEIPAATAQAPPVMAALMQGLPQPTPDYTAAIPRRPLEEPTTVPEAYREAGGGIAGIINAAGFAAEQPILRPED